MFQPKQNYRIASDFDEAVTGLRVWPVVIDYNNTTHTTGLSVVRIGRAYSVRLIENIPGFRNIRYIPATSLGSAMASVRSIMERSFYTSDEKIISMIDGRLKTIMELKL